MKEDRIYLLHIRDALGRILLYTAEGKQAFFNDARTQDAVIRNLEVVGEAVKNLSEDLKARHPAIPWKRIAGTIHVVNMHKIAMNQGSEMVGRLKW